MVTMDGMKAVGIKVLKARLSEYIREVKAGETVLVTERDEVVAELRPARRQRTGANDLEEVLERLAEKGEVRLRSSDHKPNWRSLRPATPIEDVDTDALLDELRGDR